MELKLFGELLLKYWYVIVIGLLLLAVDHYRHEAKDAKNELKVFTEQTKSVGLQAKLDNKEKEHEYENKISVANAGRTDALTRLQLAQATANSGRRASASNPVAPSGSNQICFTASGYNAAFKQFGADLDKFIQDARGFAGEGDRAAIDAAALIKAWPSQAVK